MAGLILCMVILRVCTCNVYDKSIKLNGVTVPRFFAKLCVLSCDVYSPPRCAFKESLHSRQNFFLHFKVKLTATAQHS